MVECSIYWNRRVFVMILKNCEWMPNSVDPDQTPRSAASDLGLHCLLNPPCPKSYGKW